MLLGVRCGQLLSGKVFMVLYGGGLNGNETSKKNESPNSRETDPAAGGLSAAHPRATLWITACQTGVGALSLKHWFVEARRIRSQGGSLTPPHIP